MPPGTLRTSQSWDFPGAMFLTIGTIEAGRMKETPEKSTDNYALNKLDETKPFS
jgi:hypothetical protein